LVEYLPNEQFGQMVERLARLEGIEKPAADGPVTPTVSDGNNAATSGPRRCRCGCGEMVAQARRFVSQQHQVAYLRAQRLWAGNQGQADPIA
jgi:hypothetical protein